MFVLFFPMACMGSSGYSATRHALDVKIDIPGRSISGTDRIAVVDRDSPVMVLVLRPGSEVTRVEGPAGDLPFDVRDGSDFREITVLLPQDAAVREITVHFKGTFQSTSDAQGQVKRGVAYLDDGVIGEEGVFLPSSALWYPQAGGSFMVFEARVTMPEGFSSVMEGELSGRTEADGTVTERWVEWKPIDGIDLVAGRYAVTKEEHKGVGVYTYFFKDDPELSRTYIDKTKEYLDTYNELIGPYPFGKFAVVENFMPTGYGMPSFTLLGSAVIRLPFIPNTSLGHEIAHNWWGNSVFIDSTLGNWSEALTTFTSDYMYERRKGEAQARDFRAAKLRGYKAYAGKSQLSVGEFRDATGTGSRAVGYNKGIMVFNMLELHIGQTAFRDGLRRFYADNAFRRASWLDLQRAFEAASGQDLGWFFEQWLGRPGGPELTIAEAAARASGKKHQVKFRVEQAGAPYRLDLPVRFETAAGPVWKTFHIRKQSEEIAVELESRPVSMEIDPDYQNFRIFSDSEVPPTFAGLFGDRGALAVVPEDASGRARYLGPAQMLARDYGLTVESDAEAGVTDIIRDRSALIFGGPGENRLYRLAAGQFSADAKIGEESFEVAGRSFPRKGSVLALAARHPHDPSKTLCLFMTDLEGPAAADAARRLRHFTDSSWLVITPEGRAERGTMEGEKTLKRTFK